jgi:hypothetical protein
VAQFSDSLKLAIAFAHSKSKVLTERTQATYEMLYASRHSTRSEDVWANEVAYCVDAAAANAEAVTNPAVTKYTLATLTPLSGSNNQSYYLDVGGVFIKPWIAPTDIFHPISSAPSHGFQSNIYKSDNTLITPTEGRFVFDYSAGIVQFERLFTPLDLGWGAVKVTCYVYTGAFVVSSSSPKVLYGDGPPHGIVPTGSPQLYIDIRTSTGNPLYYVLWGWATNLIYPGWRPFASPPSPLWIPQYLISTSPITESTCLDFVKNVPEQGLVDEGIFRGIIKGRIEQVSLSEDIDRGLLKPLTNTVFVSEVFDIDSVKGNIEQIPVIDFANKGASKPALNTVTILEFVDKGVIRFSGGTVEFSETFDLKSARGFTDYNPIIESYFSGLNRSSPEQSLAVEVASFTTKRKNIEEAPIEEVVVFFITSGVSSVLNQNTLNEWTLNV